MLATVKGALRIDGNDADQEIQDLIDAAMADLALAGIAPEHDGTDPLIRRAVIIYCRGHFDYDSKSAERLMQSYEMLKSHLSLAEDYREAGA